MVPAGFERVPRRRTRGAPARTMEIMDQLAGEGVKKIVPGPIGGYEEIFSIVAELQP